MRTIVLCSGGLDSTTVLAMAANAPGKVLGIAFDYGQRHDAELEAAADVCDVYGVKLEVLKAPMQSGDSVLMDHDAEMPHLTYEEIEEAEGVSPTYVPFRNGTFLALAAGYALAHGYDELRVGVHAEDARGWAYPDCTPEFIGAMANALYVGTYHKVRLVAPLQYLLKRDVVKLGLELSAPYDKTHSCYEGMRPACGRCPTCVSRLEAFKANGVRDPVEYVFDAYGSLKEAKGTKSALDLKRSLMSNE